MDFNYNFKSNENESFSHYLTEYFNSDKYIKQKCEQLILSYNYFSMYSRNQVKDFFFDFPKKDLLIVIEIFENKELYEFCKEIINIIEDKNL